MAQGRKMYIEVTRLDGSTILINKNSILAVFSENEETIIIYSGGNKQRVKESYDQIKSLIDNG